MLDKEVKEVFLDIACLFIGNGRKHATLMWEDCKFFPSITIDVLVHKSLVSINNDMGEFEMHDHIRDMVRKIVEDESFCSPGMCSSRLWNNESLFNTRWFSFERFLKDNHIDIGYMWNDEIIFDAMYSKCLFQTADKTIDILQNKIVMKNVEAIQLGGANNCSHPLEAESFAAMSQLRMLRLTAGVKLEGEYECLPKMLRWLQCRIPRESKSLLDDLHLENIVVLDLSFSSITRLWNPQTSARIKVLGKLKVLNLSGCYVLTSCPDFMIMPHLEKLYFCDCGMMSELHPSIGLLKSLTHLDLSLCESLKQLPQEIYQLTSLEVLDLSHCPKITDLSSQLGDSKTLKQQLLGDLKVLNLSNCCKLTICPDFMSMPLLEDLDFEGCMKMSELHPSIWHLKSLTRLSLRGCTSLKELAEEIGQLTKGQKFDFHECSKITILPSQMGDFKSMKRPSLEKLKVLCLNGCRYLTMCPDFGNMPHLEELSLVGCEEISELHSSIGHLKSLTNLDLGMCDSLKELPQDVSQLTSLLRLNLSYCHITALPESMGHLKQLKFLMLDGCSLLQELPKAIVSPDQLEYLIVDRCKQLKFLPKLPPSLTHLHATHCDQLETMEDVSNLKELQLLDVSGCQRLMDIPGIKQLNCSVCVWGFFASR